MWFDHLENKFVKDEEINSDNIQLYNREDIFIRTSGMGANHLFSLIKIEYYLHKFQYYQPIKLPTVHTLHCIYSTRKLSAASIYKTLSLIQWFNPFSELVLKHFFFKTNFFFCFKSIRNLTTFLKHRFHARIAVHDALDNRPFERSPPKRLIAKSYFNVNIFASGEFNFVQQFRTIMNGNPDAIALNIMLLQLVVNISLPGEKHCLWLCYRLCKCILYSKLVICGLCNVP